MVLSGSGTESSSAFTQEVHTVRGTGKVLEVCQVSYHIVSHRGLDGGVPGELMDCTRISRLMGIHSSEILPKEESKMIGIGLKRK